VGCVEESRVFFKKKESLIRRLTHFETSWAVCWRSRSIFGGFGLNDFNSRE